MSSNSVDTHDSRDSPGAAGGDLVLAAVQRLSTKAAVLVALLTSVALGVFAFVQRAVPAGAELDILSPSPAESASWASGLYLGSTTLVRSFMEDERAAALLVNAALHAISVLVLFALARRWLDPPRSLLAVLIWCGFNEVLVVQRSVSIENALVPAVLLASTSLIGLEGSRRRASAVVFLSICAAGPFAAAELFLYVAGPAVILTVSLLRSRSTTWVALFPLAGLMISLWPLAIGHPDLATVSASAWTRGLVAALTSLERALGLGFAFLAVCAAASALLLRSKGSALLFAFILLPLVAGACFGARDGVHLGPALPALAILVAREIAAIRWQALRRILAGAAIGLFLAHQWLIPWCPLSAASRLPSVGGLPIITPLPARLRHDPSRTKTLLAAIESGSRNLSEPVILVAAPELPFDASELSRLSALRDGRAHYVSPARYEPIGHAGHAHFETAPCLDADLIVLTDADPRKARGQGYYTAVLARALRTYGREYLDAFALLAEFDLETGGSIEIWRRLRPSAPTERARLLEVALVVDPDDPRLYTSLSEIYGATRQEELAEAMRRASRALSVLEHGDSSEAARLFHGVVQEFPHSIVTRIAPEDLARLKSL